MDHPPGRFMTSLVDHVIRRSVWIMLGWVAVVATLNVAVPQIEAVVADDSTPVVPAGAQSVRALDEMDRVFGTGHSKSFVLVVLERRDGLTRVDVRWAESLIDKLRAHGKDVSFVQDIAANADLRKALTSKDGAALYFQVGIPGDTGAPQAIRQIEAIRETLAGADPPAGLRHAVTGPAATISDTAVEVERSLVPITLVTVLLIGAILTALYRSLLVTAIVLGSVGVSLLASRAVIAWLGLNDLLDVSTFTGSFLTAVVLGAATDYAVFLMSRYQEERRRGLEHREAVRRATTRIGGVIVGSAVTVMAANAAMLLADIGFFRTTGPAVAISVAITLGASLTLLPAAIVVLGRTGRLDPRPTRERAGAGWDRVAGIVVARPTRVLVGALVPLVALAAFYPAIEQSFDQRAVQPEDTDSNRGYELLAAHYPVNEALPNYVIVRSDKDLRTPKRLAALEKLAATVAQHPGVSGVRGITRPLGTPIAEASAGYQAGAVGDRLGKASQDIAAGRGDADRLVDGAGTLTSGSRDLADGAQAAVAAAGQLASGVDQLSAGVEQLASGADGAAAGASQLRAGMQGLAAGLTTAADQTAVAVDGLGQALKALEGSIGCTVAPICSRARDGVRQVYEGERDQLLPGLRKAATAARQLAAGTVDLDTGLSRLRSGMNDARTGAQQLRSGQHAFHQRLGELASGADQVADGTRQLAGGTGKVVASLDELSTGLADAATHLRRTRDATLDPAVGGFYLPPAALEDRRFASAASLFLSSDGHVARMMVLPRADAFSIAARQDSAELLGVSTDALAGTALRDAEVSTTGLAVLNSDLLEFERGDFLLVALVALTAVLLILIALLRSLVAPVVLLASVLLSYLSAIGLGVLVWQVLLGQELDWTVGTMTFILLVAVGADYNLLLVKRIQEEAPDGSRAGIARATSATGRVITSAGLIFASSMFALMAGSVTTLAQIGFTIGMGLLLDTFLVRTLVVPAAAALLGPRLWWPNRSRATAPPSASPAVPESAPSPPPAPASTEAAT